MSVNQVRLLNGAALAVDPPIAALDSFADLHQRVAASLEASPGQLKFFCNARELTGSGTIEDVLGGEDANCIEVLVRPAYEEQVAKAKRATGLVRVCHVDFPTPQGICVNMMPFIMGDEKSIPEDLGHYWPLIQACPLPHEEKGKVGYLTIHESLVAEGESQRRRGLHLEAPGVVLKEGRVFQTKTAWGVGYLENHLRGSNYRFQVCDVGYYSGLHISDYLKGGIYTASTVADSCRAWNMRIAEPEKIVGSLGDAEHLREFLDDGTMLEPSTLYWMTDATPHESMPLAEGTYRQYFRLVTSSVSVWYSMHSTKNPLGVEPDSQATQILTHDKFLDLEDARQNISVLASSDEVWYLMRGDSGEAKLLRQRLRKAGFTSETSSRGSSVGAEEEVEVEIQAADRGAMQILAESKLKAELRKAREILGCSSEYEEEEELCDLIQELKRGKQLDAGIARLIDLDEEVLHAALKRDTDSSESASSDESSESASSDESSDAASEG